MHRITMSSLLLLTPFVVAVASPVSAFDVTGCYQSVPAGQVGELQVDLVCDGSGGPNVTIQRGGKLRLNGHTISGGYLGIATEPAGKRVTIEGPGEVFGATGTAPLGGCAIGVTVKTTIKNVILHDNRCGIGRPYDYAIRLQDVTIDANTEDAIEAASSGPGNGRVVAKNVTITNNGGLALQTDGRSSLRGATITNNASGGVYFSGARRSSLFDGTLTGNGPQGDVAAATVPRFVRSTYTVSQNLGGGSLGICADD